MCGTCGCGEPEGAGHIVLDHDHPEHGREQIHDHGPARADVKDAPTLIHVKQAILAENNRFAALNRSCFEAQRTRCFNLISAPGSGKTTLLEMTLAALRARSVHCAVIEGDQATDLDARRIARTGAPVVQIETGRSCHLDAHQVHHALERLTLPSDGLLFIENVGNLICPTEFPLGEHERVTIMSVVEGHDKPAKYPLAFRTATTVVITKMDLIAHVDFDRPEAHRLIRGLNPHARVFELSARTGEGLNGWIEWLESNRKK